MIMTTEEMLIRTENMGPSLRFHRGEFLRQALGFGRLGYCFENLLVFISQFLETKISTLLASLLNLMR